MKCCVTVNGVLFPFGTTQEVEGEVIATAQLDLKDACVINNKLSMRTIFKPGYEKLICPVSETVHLIIFFLPLFKYI